MNNPIQITAILSSPTKNGSTCILTREILRGAQNSGAITTEIFLPDYNISYCKGCISRDIQDHCMSTGKCIQHDDVNKLKDILSKSDGIILASPTYGIKPNACMKNFIVDRIGMYTAYTSSFGGKYFIGVSTAGGIGAKIVAKELSNSFIVGFHQRGFRTGFISAIVGKKTLTEQPEKFTNAYYLGKKIVNDVKKQKKYYLQKFPERLLNRIIVRRLILQNIYKNKNGSMKAVYSNLVSRGLIKP